MAERRIAIGKFGRPHGRHGKLRLWLYNDETELVAPGASATLEWDEPRVVVFTTIQPRERFVIVGIEGVKNRDQAAELNHKEIWVDRDQLPEPDEDEFYASDLIGFDIDLLDDEGGTIRIGRLKGFLDNVDTDVFIVTGPRIKGRWLVAFTPDSVADVDVDAECLTLAPLSEWAHDDQVLLPE